MNSFHLLCDHYQRNHAENGTKLRSGNCQGTVHQIDNVYEKRLEAQVDMKELLGTNEHIGKKRRSGSSRGIESRSDTTCLATSKSLISQLCPAL